jgi:hypothetical protein
MKNPFSRLARWLVFTVFLALVPVLSAALRMRTFSKPVSLAILTAHGELLLVATAVAGSAIGELITSRTGKKRSLKVICSGMCLLAIIMSSGWFADIASAHEASGLIDPSFIAYGSLTMMILALLAGGSCVVVSEV